MDASYSYALSPSRHFRPAGFRMLGEAIMAKFPATEHEPDRLTRVEQRIGNARKLYLEATWAGHQGEADWWESEVDRLLTLWQHITRRVPLTATEQTLCD